jgi:hypothetical protein
VGRPVPELASLIGGRHTVVNRSDGSLVLGRWRESCECCSSGSRQLAEHRFHSARLSAGGYSLKNCCWWLWGSFIDHSLIPLPLPAICSLNSWHRLHLDTTQQSNQIIGSLHTKAHSLGRVRSRHWGRLHRMSGLVHWAIGHDGPVKHPMISKMG